MKLAEALNLRADVQKRIASLKERLIRNAKVQEGDVPAEDPVVLLKELDGNIIELEKLIKAINKTNSLTYIEGESITDIIAKRDALGLKLSVLRSFIDTASEKIDRYSNKEIKILSTVNVSEKQEEVDKLSKEYRLIDTKLQSLNWTIDLVE
ncbi:DIP1984 family protein [Clostridium sp.]|uniref:DIP1984 family protein n=1 Tax=Clostridium sp. TaxID=1506 RepID=UPI0025B7AA14|nr:DIP1984 family protein [Clostridium sp.]MCI9304606.1 DIP1984 family protein [Clostridium sp.]